MKKLHECGALLLAGTLALLAGHGGTKVEPSRAAPVLGTFDSRALAIAYVRSPAFSEYIGAQKVDVDRMIARARDAGDLRLVADLDALGPAMQKRVHEQSFGSAPVDDIVARIADRLPDLAAEAGVDAIVSKWELDFLAPDTELVDVTELLVAEFEPDAATWKVIHEIRRTDPVPLDQLSHDH